MTADFDVLESQWRSTGRVANVGLAAIFGGWTATYLASLFWFVRLTPSELFYGSLYVATSIFVIAIVSAVLTGYLAAVLIKRPAIRRWSDSPIAARVSTLLGLCLLGAGLVDLYVSTHPLILMSVAFMGLPGLALAFRTRSHVNEPMA